MKKTQILGIVAVASTMAMATSAGAQTQWIKDKMSDQCSAASKDKIAEDVRANIEDSVRRAEASIQAPASVVDLSCMSDLLGANIDVFSQDWSNIGGFSIDGMINDVVGGLKSGLNVQTLSSGVERAICDFAKEKFEGVTSGLTGSLSDITNGLEMPDFGDGFGLLNTGYNGDSTGGTTGGTTGDPDVSDEDTGGGSTDGNSSPTGPMGILGDALVGQTLTARPNSIEDADGIVSGSGQFQWLSNGQPISGATSQTYRVTSTDQGDQLSVSYSYRDQAGNTESVVSSPRPAVPPTTVMTNSTSSTESAIQDIWNSIGGGN